MITGQFPPEIGGGGQVVYNLSNAIVSSKKVKRVVIVVSNNKECRPCDTNKIYRQPLDEGCYSQIRTNDYWDVVNSLGEKNILVKRIKASFSPKCFQVEQAIQEIQNVVKEENINLIHAHHFLSIYLGSIIKESYGNIPLVASSYKVPPLFNSTFQQIKKSDPNYALFNHITRMKVDVWIAYSKIFAKDLMKNYGVSRRKVKLIYPGVEISKTVTDNPSNDVIVSPGRLDHRKRYERVIEAVCQYNHNKNDNKKIVLTGSPANKGERKYRNKLKAEANVCGVDLKFITYKFNEKSKIYRSRYACVLPSDREGLSLVMLESLAEGCPLIISEQANQGDMIIKNEVNGLIFNSEVDGDLEARLKDLNDLSLRKKIIKGGKDTIRKQFSIRNFAKKTLDVYMSVVP